MACHVIIVLLIIIGIVKITIIMIITIIMMFRKWGREGENIVFYLSTTSWAGKEYEGFCIMNG